MKVLAIECTAKTVSVAIAQNGRLIGDSFYNVKLTHSETLLPLIFETLKNARLTLADIGAFAVTAGPGSFTGIRIGISVIKGLAFAENKPVYPFSSLTALALGNLGQNGTLFTLMDARASRYYAAAFEINGQSCSRIREDEILTQNELENILQTLYNKKQILLAGDGAALFLEKAGQPFNAALVPPAFLLPRAAGMAVLCSASPPVPPISPDLLQPVYLIQSQAQRERKEQ